MAILTDSEIAGAAKSAGFTGTDLGIAVAVALAESGGNPTAVNDRNANGSVDRGLFQINSIHSALLATGNVFNPTDNARMAFTIYSEAGHKWSPWSAYKSGSYLRYLARGRSAAGNPTAVGASGSNPASSATLVGSLGALATFADFISNAHNWVRAGYFLLGLALAAYSLAQITGAAEPIGKAVKLAATVAVPEGKIASTVAKAVAVK